MQNISDLEIVLNRPAELGGQGHIKKRVKSIIDSQLISQ